MFWYKATGSFFFTFLGPYNFLGCLRLAIPEYWFAIFRGLALAGAAVWGLATATYEILEVVTSSAILDRDVKTC